MIEILLIEVSSLEEFAYSRFNEVDFSFVIL